MLYVQVEEKIHRAKTFKGLVKKLWLTSFDDAINKAKYMFNVKVRIKELYDKYIRTENYYRFIMDLDKLKLIKIYRCKDCDYYISKNRCMIKPNEIIIPSTCDYPCMTCKIIEVMKEQLAFKRKQKDIEFNGDSK